MDFQVSILFVTASVNSLLSLFVLFGKKSKTNIIYSVFVLFASLWATGLAFFILEKDLEFSLYLANFYYISAAAIPVFFLYFSMVFLEDENRSYVRPLIVVPFILLTSLFIFDKHFLIKEIYLQNWGKNVHFNSLNYLIYSIYFLVFVLLSYFKLFYSFFTTKDLENKSQLRFIIMGTSVGFIFGMIFNLVLPFLGDYRHIYLGPAFSFFMVASIAYSITKHHLFDMKVIITEMLMFILWIFIFMRTILSNNTEDQIINGSLLLIVVLIGIFLIRGVKREVEQRERIQNLANDLQKANQGQSSILHFMNHQIKGRLGNIKNIFAELMTDDYGVMPEDSKFLLEKGLEEANTGVNYVQNILNGASAENGTLPYDMKPVDFRLIVESVSTKEREYAQKKGLSFVSDMNSGSYEITGDKLQLSEAVRNLIDNSINYTPTGSVSVRLFDNIKNIRLEIKDSGVGLSPEDKQKLFKAGGRGEESLKVNINSTGYGLVFVKGVIEAHKGRVWAESEGRDKGSLFVVEIPKKA